MFGTPKSRTHCCFAEILSYLAPALASLMIVHLVIRASSLYGRLSTHPVVDNINYMASGAIWFRAWHTGGLSELVAQYMTRTPHGPYSVAASFLAYLLLGVNDRAAHAASIVPLMIVLSFAWSLTRQVSLFLRLVIIGLVSTVPLWTWSIEIVKPDYFAGFITSCALVLTIIHPSRRRKASWFFGIGVLWGFALWSKPAVFPGTIWYCGVTIAIRTWLSVSSLSRTRIIQLIRESSLVCLGAMFVAGPHYVIDLEHIVHYISDILVGNRQANWRYNGTQLQHIAYYSMGHGGDVMLGNARYWLTIVCVIGGALALTNRSKAVRRSAFAFTVMLLAAYLVPTLSPMKIREFAVVFQTFLIFTAVISIVFIGRTIRHRSIQFLAVAALAAALVFSVATLQWKIPLVSLGSNKAMAVAADNKVVERLYDLVRTASSSLHSYPRNVSVVIGGAPSAFSWGLVNFWAIRDNIPIRATARSTPRSIDDLYSCIKSADVIVANEGGTGFTRGGTNSEAWNKQFLDGVRRLPLQYKEFAKLQVGNSNRSYYIFVRILDQSPNEVDEAFDSDDSEDDRP